MADLDDDIGKHIPGCLPDGRIVITGDRDERVVHVPELREELYPGFKTLRAGEDATGKVMGGVIHAVEEGNLFGVPFHLHILTISYKRTAEAFAIAVVVGNLVVVGKLLKLFYDPPVCRTNTDVSSVSKSADACSFQVKTEKGFCILAAVIDVEPRITILTVKSVYSSSNTLFPDMIGRAGRTMWTMAL